MSSTSENYFHPKIDHKAAAERDRLCALYFPKVAIADKVSRKRLICDLAGELFDSWAKRRILLMKCADDFWRFYNEQLSYYGMIVEPALQPLELGEDEVEAVMLAVVGRSRFWRAEAGDLVEQYSGMQLEMQSAIDSGALHNVTAVGQDGSGASEKAESQEQSESPTSQATHSIEGQSFPSTPRFLSVPLDFTDLPPWFSEQSRHRITAAIIRADRAFADTEKNGRLVRSERQHLAIRYICSVLAVVTKEAFHDNPPHSARTEIREVLRNLIFDVERTKCGHQGILIRSGEVCPDVMAALARSPEWRDYEDEILQRSDSSTLALIESRPVLSAGEAKNKRGPTTDLKTAEQVQEVVKSIADIANWRPRLMEICIELDDRNIPVPKTWKKYSCRDWLDGSTHYPKLAAQAIEYRLKLCAQK